MSSLREILLTRYAEMVTRRVSVPEDHAGPVTPNGRNPHGEVWALADQARYEQELRRILGILEDRNRLIERLKATDERRQALHERMKGRWRAKQMQTAQLRRRIRVLRKVLRRRRNSLLEMGRKMKMAGQQSAGNMHIILSTMDAPAPLPRHFMDSLLRRILSWFPSVTGLLWKHWMRLGVLKQYVARPLRAEHIPAPRVTTAELPKISIVTPSYNQAPFVEETMRSVLDQGYPHLEYIVMDGGSTDGSVEIIRQHQAKLAHLQSGPDGGQAAAVQKGLAKATGDIMAWLNSDDLLMPGSLALVGDYFARHPEVDVVYGHRVVVNANSHEVGRWVLPRHDDELLLWADFVPQETLFWRRRIYEKAGGMDPSFHFALDWDLLLRFQKAGARMVRLPWFLGSFRIHPEQKNAMSLETGYQEMKLLRERELGDEFNSGSLATRVHRAQAKALLLTCLMRLGIRL